MFKLGLLSVLLTIVVAAMGNEMDKFLGEVIPVALTPEPKFTRCKWYTFQKSDNDNVKCTCGDKTDLTKYIFKVFPFTESFVPIIVNSPSEAEAALAIKSCSCAGEKTPRFVFKAINDNYFLQYDSIDSTPGPSLVILYVKNAPKKSELENIIDTIDYFSNKNYTMLCDSTFFAKEN